MNSRVLFKPSPPYPITHCRRRKIILLLSKKKVEYFFFFCTCCGIQTEEEEFFSSSTYTGWGEKKYSTSLHQKIFAHPDTSPSINRRRRNILLLSTRKSLPTQTRAPPSKEEEERRRILFLLLHILRLGRHHTLEFKDTRRRRILFLFLYLLREKQKISSSSVDGGARVWVGKNFLVERSRIFFHPPSCV